MNQLERVLDKIDQKLNDYLKKLKTCEEADRSKYLLLLNRELSCLYQFQSYCVNKRLREIKEIRQEKIKYE
jgi:hypothetical protein